MDGPETLRVINSENRILLIEMLINSELSIVDLTLEICMLLKIHVLENGFYGSFGKFFGKFWWCFPCFIVSVLEFGNILKFSEHFTRWKVSVFGVSLFHIFPHSEWVRKDTPYLSVFCLNMEEYEPVKLWIRAVFMMISFFRKPWLATIFLIICVSQSAI